ncbi:DsbA family oxidoreductase [Georgenia faecalis]|uniref:DsbA family protein n=1 Tax=Georgenia faecalis TaxID=2483799 RepID=A0ABV9DA94_9MICO|nr:DsbA family oxidoreductase [Georgenia faecalis]
MSTPLTVDIWSDIACPWCYIGKRKFEAGLAALPDADDVVVTYRSFELSPDTPLDFEGSAVDFLSEHKGIPADQVEAMLGQVTEIARSVGLSYDFAAVRQTKTLVAHEALHHAKAHGRQLELVERLLAAYFEEGRHLGRAEEVADLAAEVGLDRDDVLRALETHEHADAVQADIAQARAYGITGVPFFVIDGRYGISGAQNPEVFTAALEQVRAERAGVAS